MFVLLLIFGYDGTFFIWSLFEYALLAIIQHFNLLRYAYICQKIVEKDEVLYSLFWHFLRSNLFNIFIITNPSYESGRTIEPIELRHSVIQSSTKLYSKILFC